MHLQSILDFWQIFCIVRAADWIEYPDPLFKCVSK